MTTNDDTTPTADRTAELPPLLAGWLRDRREFASYVGGTMHRQAHRTLWHTLRLPLYALRLALYAPRGLWRVCRLTWDVMSDGEGRPLRVDAVQRRESREYLALRRERNDRIHRRLVVSGAILSLALCLAVVLIVLDSAGVVTLPPSWLLGFAMVQALGFVGRPLGKPIARPATVLAGNPGPPSAPFVMAALVSLGIQRMTKVEDIGLLFDVARVGPGYQVDLELPRGVTAAAVMDRRSELSAALRRELGCVWPSVGKRHAAHLVLYVADEPMSTAKQARWPLLKDGAVNVFRPAPAFTDQRGTWVDLTLAYTSGVIGAVSRVGKTFALREILLIAGLDPRTKVYAIDLKGTGDLAPVALFAHFYSVGDDREEIAEQLAALREVREEMRRRAKVIRSLSHDECPENKVTDTLASRRDLGLEPIVIGIDECQFLFQHEDKQVREEATALCSDLCKRGPALGVICYFATQKPDAKSIPTPIADNAVIRLAFKVTGQVSNDQILGTSSYRDGLRATLFSFEDKGVAILKGEGADARIVRTVVGLDAPTAEKVAARARQARHQAGRLTGAAAGDTMAAEAEQVRFLDDVRQVLASRPAIHLADAASGLATLRPALYGTLTAETAGKLLRAAGVGVGTVWDPSKSRDEGAAKGVKAEWLDGVAATDVLGDEDAPAAD